MVRGVDPIGVGVTGAVGATTEGAVVPVEATTGVVDVVGATVPVETSEVTGGVGVTVGVEDDGAGDVGVETTGDVGVLVVTTSVDDDGADTDELDDELEVLVDPPPPETTGAELSITTGVGVLVVTIGVVVDFAFRSIFIASILFLRSESTIALTIVSGVIVLALTLRIACTNERDFLFAFADCTIAFASTTFCL